MQKRDELCGVCGWFKSEHMYNVHCPAATAAYDQTLAEVAESMQEPVEPGLVEKAIEVARETIARFVRDLQSK